MSNDNTLVLVPKSILSLSPVQMSSIQFLAQTLVKSSLTYKKDRTVDDLILIMIKGVEIGLAPMAAISFIHVIQGTPSLSPQGMLALIYASGQLEDMTISDDGTTCTVTMKRKGLSPHSETFSIEKAKELGLGGRDAWRKQPENMRKWRAVSACARIVFSDIIHGLYTTEELHPDVVIDGDGEVIEAIEPINLSMDSVTAPPAKENTGLIFADGDTRNKFTAWADEHYQMAQDQVLGALQYHTPEIKTLGEYPGTASQARTCVMVWYSQNENVFFDDLLADFRKAENVDTTSMREFADTVLHVRGGIAPEPTPEPTYTKTAYRASYTKNAKGSSVVTFFDAGKDRLPIPALWGRDMLRALDGGTEGAWHTFVGNWQPGGESVELPAPIVIEYNANKVLSMRLWVNLIADTPEVIQPSELKLFRQNFDRKN